MLMFLFYGLPLTCDACPEQGRRKHRRIQQGRRGLTLKFLVDPEISGGGTGPLMGDPAFRSTEFPIELITDEYVVKNSE